MNWINLFFTPLLGEDTLLSSAGDFAEGQTYNYWSDFVNMLATLAFVILLIFLTVWFLKKIMRGRVKALNRLNGIKILERRPLSSKSALYLVDILGKAVVISESPSGIRVVTEFAEGINVEEKIEQMQQVQSEGATFAQSFSEKLKQLTAKKKC